MPTSKETSALKFMMDRMHDLVLTIDAEGRIIEVNNAVKLHLDTPISTLIGNQLNNTICFKDSDQASFLAEAKLGNATPRAGYFKIGQQVVSVTLSAIWSESDGCFFCVAYPDNPAPDDDIKIKEMNRLLLEHGSEMHALVDENGHYLFGNLNYLQQWGYTPEQLDGINALNLLHPDDVAKAAEAIQLAMHSKEVVHIDDFRFRTADGQWRWIKGAISNELANPAIKALYSTFSDITQQKEAELLLQESEQRFRSLFENNPDMVIYQNEDGLIVDANPAFLEFYGKSKEEVINRSVLEFLPLAAGGISPANSLISSKGNQGSFIAEIDLQNAGKKVVSIKEVPLWVKDKIIAIHFVIRDITSETLALRTVEQQAKKLNTIFESITDAFCTLDRDWKFTYLNSEYDRIVGTNRNEITGKYVWEVFPEEVGGIFYQQYHKAVQEGIAVHFEAYLSRINSWLEVKAFPSEEGLSIYFYDITQRIHAKEELEKLSLVAQNTTNSVIITDAEGLTEWVNEGFTNLTGYTLSEISGKKPGQLLQGPETDPGTVKNIAEGLHSLKPFSYELLNYKKSGQKFWCYTEITPIFNKEGHLTRYIAVQSDISLRKEEEIQILKMAQDLYQKNSDLQQFTYIISHNLRSPVANALGFAGLLLKLNKASDRYDTSLKYLYESIHRLDEVLRDVSQILSIRDKGETVGMESIRILDVWEQALSDLLDSLQKCQGVLEVRVEEGLEVNANRAYLHSIFHNLLTNAIKYRSDERGLTVCLEAFSVPEGGTIIKFADNGSGFDMERAGKNLFKMYKRFHPGKDGKGIGLFLVKTHVEAMGGKIEVNSQVNVGTTFTIHLNEKAANELP